MLCWETFGPDIQLDVTFTHSTYLNTVAGQVHPFIAAELPNGTGIKHCHIVKIAPESLAEHDKGQIPQTKR